MVQHSHQVVGMPAGMWICNEAHYNCHGRQVYYLLRLMKAMQRVQIYEGMTV